MYLSSKNTCQRERGRLWGVDKAGGVRHQGPRGGLSLPLGRRHADTGPQRGTLKADGPRGVRRALSTYGGHGHWGGGRRVAGTMTDTTMHMPTKGRQGLQGRDAVTVSPPPPTAHHALSAPDAPARLLEPHRTEKGTQRAPQRV